MRQSSCYSWRVAGKAFISCCPGIWRPGNHFRPPQILCNCHRCHYSGSGAIYFDLQLAYYGIRWYAALNKTNYKIGLLEIVNNAFRKNFCNFVRHRPRHDVCTYYTSARLRQSPRSPWRVANDALNPCCLDSWHRGYHLR